MVNRHNLSILSSGNEISGSKVPQQWQIAAADMLKIEDVVRNCSLQNSLCFNIILLTDVHWERLAIAGFLPIISLSKDKVSWPYETNTREAM